LKISPQLARDALMEEALVREQQTSHHLSQPKPPQTAMANLLNAQQ
jgi:hypothetical protein